MTGIAKREGINTSTRQGRGESSGLYHAGVIIMLPLYVGARRRPLNSVVEGKIAQCFGGCKKVFYITHEKVLPPVC